jgi:hypothetical protein
LLSKIFKDFERRRLVDIRYAAIDIIDVQRLRAAAR